MLHNFLYPKRKNHGQIQEEYKLILSFFHLIHMRKILPKVFEFFLRSNATSKILPFKTEINFPCDFFV